MTIALLFPGQGASRLENAVRFAASSERGRTWLDLAGAAADVPPARFVERPEILDATAVAQPVITAVSIFVATELAAGGVRPDVVVGHSLGEIAAWAAAGGIDSADAIGVAALRGRLMAEAARRCPGGLVAIATSDEATIAEALAIGRRAGSLAIAARNAPDETVLAGDEAALRAVLAGAGVPATRVPTGGAWHGPAMERAREPFRDALERLPRRQLRCPWISNRDGALVRDAGAVPLRLVDQLVRPVELSACLATAASVASDWVTIGPGSVLRSLVRRNVAASPSRLHATDDARALAATIAALGGHR